MQSRRNAKQKKRPSETSLSLRFQGVIQRAAEKWGRNVVVLIDEYDKPMLQAIGNDELLADYRNMLKAFYGVMKSCDRCIYVMEFKLDDTAKEALQQIHDKQYALPFASDSRKLFKVGVNFSKETRGIEGWIVED